MSALPQSKQTVPRVYVITFVTSYQRENLLVPTRHYNLRAAAAVKIESSRNRFLLLRDRHRQLRLAWIAQVWLGTF